MTWNTHTVSGEHFTVASDYYDLEGNEITQDEWVVLFEDANKWQLIDEGEGVKVSTVYLGLNHNFDKDGPPLFFESLVWVDDDEIDQHRYKSWDDAKTGHNILWFRYRRKREWAIGESVVPISHRIVKGVDPESAWRGHGLIPVHPHLT